MTNLDFLNFLLWCMVSGFISGLTWSIMFSWVRWSS